MLERQIRENELYGNPQKRLFSSLKSIYAHKNWLILAFRNIESILECAAHETSALKRLHKLIRTTNL